jgi:RNase P/RNase MRP subunit p29
MCRRTAYGQERHMDVQLGGRHGLHGRVVHFTGQLIRKDKVGEMFLVLVKHDAVIRITPDPGSR